MAPFSAAFTHSRRNSRRSLSAAGEESVEKHRDILRSTAASTSTQATGAEEGGGQGGVVVGSARGGEEAQGVAPEGSLWCPGL